MNFLYVVVIMIGLGVLYFHDPVIMYGVLAIMWGSTHLTESNRRNDAAKDRQDG